jgi:uncharacterized protein with HEPN domain
MINTDKMSQDDFIKNTEAKERTYFMLQEIGHNANDIVNHLEVNEKEHNLLSVLKPLRTARYNLQSEINDQMVFDIIKRDLPEVQQTISKTFVGLQSEESIS